MNDIPEEPRLGRFCLYFGRLLLVLLAFAFSALVCEGLLRLAWDNPYHRRAQHESIVRLRAHAPLEEILVDRSAIEPTSPTVPMRIDERGYVRPTRRLKQPDATIVFLGGSTTECAAVDEEQRFPVLVSKLFEERHRLRVTTLNAGVAGNTVHDSLNLLLNHVIADRPSVAVMMHAYNDIGVLGNYGSYRLSEPLDYRAPLLWLIREGSSYSSLVALLRVWQRREIRDPGPSRRWRKDPRSAPRSIGASSSHDCEPS